MWISSQHVNSGQVVPGDAGLYGRTQQQMSISPGNLPSSEEHTIA